MPEMHKVILIKRKGMNYYEDVIERYLENAFSTSGFHLTLRKEDTNWNCTLEVNEDEPWMIFSAPWLEMLDEKKTDTLVNTLSENFKTTVKLSEKESFEPVLPRSEVCQFGFTKNGVSAFDEPPFISDGKPFIRRKTYPTHPEIGTVVASFQNFGGSAKGLSVEITVPKEITVDEFELGYYRNWRICKSFSKAEQVRIKADALTSGKDSMLTYKYISPDFIIPDGVNIYSRKLFGKNKYDMHTLHSFFIRFVTSGNEKDAHDFVIRAIPHTAPENYAEILLK